MPDPFLVDSHEVSQLSSETFLRLVNRLVCLEARRLKIPPTDVDVTLRDTAPDEGVDARVAAGLNESSWIPSGSSVWQYKRGNAPGPAAIRKEMRKSAVVECIRRGGTYIFVVQADCSDKMIRSRIAALDEGRKGIRPNRGSKTILLTAAKLADWASEHPAVNYVFGKFFAGVWPAGEWLLHQAEHRGEFRQDDARQAFINAALTRFEDPDGPIHLRLEGAAGVGKTRLGIGGFQGLGLGGSLHSATAS